MKLYLWFDQPWWRPGRPGLRTTTDLPLRKVYYFDGQEGSRSALLAMYADGLDFGRGSTASTALPRERRRRPRCSRPSWTGLRAAHPEVARDPGTHRLGTHVLGRRPSRGRVALLAGRGRLRRDPRLAPQPEATLPIYIANEAFSRHQSWVEGALEAADAVIERLT